jgi:hypothetical protein
MNSTGYPWTWPGRSGRGNSRENQRSNSGFSFRGYVRVCPAAGSRRRCWPQRPLSDGAQLRREFPGTRLQSMTKPQAPMTIQARMTECLFVSCSSCLRGFSSGQLRHLRRLRWQSALVVQWSSAQAERSSVRRICTTSVQDRRIRDVVSLRRLCPEVVGVLYTVVKCRPRTRIR